MSAPANLKWSQIRYIYKRRNVSLRLKSNQQLALCYFIHINRPKYKHFHPILLNIKYGGLKPTRKSPKHKKLKFMGQKGPCMPNRSPAAQLWVFTGMAHPHFYSQQTLYNRWHNHSTRFESFAMLGQVHKRHIKLTLGYQPDIDQFFFPGSRYKPPISVHPTMLTNMPRLAFTRLLWRWEHDPNMPWAIRRRFWL